MIENDIIIQSFGDPLIMATPTLSFFFFLFLCVFLLFPHPFTASKEVCNKTTSCPNSQLPIQFPFNLIQPNKTGPLCGYPGFDLSCRGSKTMISIPGVGELLVKYDIDYEEQKIAVNDPHNCLPKKYMNGLTQWVAASQFEYDTQDAYSGLAQVTFLDCPSNVTEQFPLTPISCLANNGSTVDDHPRNYTVLAVAYDFLSYLPVSFEQCETLTTVPVPIGISGPMLPDLYSDIHLRWYRPNCGQCLARGGECGFVSDSSLRVGCFNLPSQGFSRSAKYGIAIGVGIPGLLAVIGFASYIGSKVRRRSLRSRQQAMELSNLIIPAPHIVMRGLDGRTIEKYPKTMLGGSRRLPNPNDGTCSICLSEYQPKETLRTIPECNHYFHADCIDGWLKMNATCPLCRKSAPSESSFVTTSSPLSLTSSSRSLVSSSASSSV